ncbi:MAG TPA: hypothetical protein VND93_21415 [Myxococcales bacterium]|nr:hypothetical protein [Myxococcales bacterium]
MPRQPAELEPALERLYAAPFEAFTETRDALAKEARAAGNAELAAALKKERKPPVTAWALDALARRKPDAVKSFLESGERMRAAQDQAVRGGGADALRDATAEQRHLLSGLLKDAMALVREAGSAGSNDQQDRMEGTLLACANGPPELREALREGRLEKDVPRPGFGDLSGGAGVFAAAAAPTQPAPPRPEKADGADREDRERGAREQRELERRRKDAEHRAREATRALQEARKKRERAEESARRAVDALAEATQGAQRARDALSEAEVALEKAEAEAREADQALVALK